MRQNLKYEHVAPLIERYDRPGPRYTSYPTAPAWTDTFDAAAYERELSGRHSTTRPLSLYLHVPFCQERCLYCGCNVVIAKNDSIAVPYVDSLLTEIELTLDRLPGPRRVVQLHLGGGTPTYLSPGQLQTLINVLKTSFEFDADAELSVEVDPGVTSTDHLKALRSLGLHRISMGVQDLDPRVQQAVHREQSTESLKAFFDQCRSQGFDSINVDLIYGLPHQTPASFDSTVDTILSWEPDRVALFSYAHVPWIKPHQRLMDADKLPTPQDKLRIFLSARSRFLDANYDAIGMDHFARHDDELAAARRRGELRRNFMGYTTKPQSDVLAFGMSAISEVGSCYAQNQSRLSHYQRDVGRGALPTQRGVRLSDDDKLRRDVIMDIMCNTALDKRRIEQLHGIEFDTTFAQELQALVPLAKDGLIELNDGGFTVTDVGQVLLRNVAMVFDRYLPENADQVLYSRTV